MAKTRKLTIASLAHSGWIRVNEVANTDFSFGGLSKSNLTVTRSGDGMTYNWNCDINDIRIYIMMDGPDDLPFITWSGEGAGFFVLEGFPQQDFPSGGASVGGGVLHAG